MSYQAIKYEKEDGYCVITLNRPEALNSLNRQMSQELSDAIGKIMDDDEIKVFIFTGAPRPDGRPCFCAGLDLREAAAGSSGGGAPAGGAPAGLPGAAETHWGLWAHSRLRPSAGGFGNLPWLPKISIAAVDGVCTAGGIELATSCDIIVVSETAQISDMHVKNLGWVGGGGAPVNIAWRIGPARAIELCCTGDVIDGKEAYRIGLANHVFSPDKLLDGAKELASKIGKMRLAAVTMTKAICRSVEDMDHRTSLFYNHAGLAALYAEPDATEWGPGRWVKQR